MIKVKGKEYKLKKINLDTRFEILDLIAIQEGNVPKPSVILAIMRTTVDISDTELEKLSAVNMGEIAGKAVEQLTEGKKK